MQCTEHFHRLVRRFPDPDRICPDADEFDIAYYLKFKLAPYSATSFHGHPSLEMYINRVIQNMQNCVREEIVWKIATIPPRLNVWFSRDLAGEITEFL